MTLIVLILLVVLGFGIYLVKDNVYAAFLLTILAALIGVLYSINALSVAFVIIVLAYIIAVISLILVAASTFERESPYINKYRILSTILIIVLMSLIVVSLLHSNTFNTQYTLKILTTYSMKMMNQEVLNRWLVPIMLTITITVLSMLAAIQLSRRGEVD